MLGSRRKNELGKEVPNYLRLPKTDLEKAIYGVIDAGLDYVEKTEGRDGIQSLIDVATSFSPITLGVDRKKVLQSTTAGVLSAVNPVIKVPAELTANYDFYRQRQLESLGQQQLHPFAREKAGTTETAKRLGRAAATTAPDGALTGGLSPIKVQHAVTGFTGGVGKQALDISDALMRRLGRAPGDLSTGALSAVAKVPIVRKMVGQFEPRPEAVDVARELAGEIKMDKATAKELASRALLAHIKQKTPESQAAVSEAMRTAAKVDPEIPLQAQAAAIRRLTRDNLSEAYALFQSMGPKDRQEMLRRLSATEDGMAIKAQLFREFQKQQQEP
jgi:hypothetical protein